MLHLFRLPGFACLVLFLCGSLSSWLQANQDRPNIILIYLDDFGWRDTGFNGSKFYETPNMDRIASQGMDFPNAYANAPNCAPSRACLMSGQYSPRHGIYTVGNSDRGKAKARKLIPIKNRTILPAKVPTMADAIHDAGYATCFLGKWHLGDKETGPLGQGFDSNFGGLSWGHPKGYFSPYKNPYLADGPKGEYLTDRLTDEAIGFIERQQESSTKKPFFVCLSHYAVHTPIQAKKEVTEKYLKKTPVDDQKNAKYAAMIESVDAGIGKIFKTLSSFEIAENTLVILYSDNGGYGGATVNTPLRGCKGMMYEGGIRVPLAMVWPKVIKPGSTCTTPVIGTDLYPTLLEIAGGQPPENHELDGLSIVPLLKGETGLSRDAIYWHFPAYLQGGFKGARNGDRQFRTRPAGAIRMGNWKLIEFFEDGGLELYDLANDVSEKNNLAQTNQAKRDELHDKLVQWRKETKAPVPTKPNPDYRPN